MWQQVYDPFGNPVVSTILAALPIVVLLGSLAFFRMRAHIAALLALAVSIITAIFAFGMPADLAGRTAIYGALFGFLPIGWIIINVIFLYKLTQSTGRFKIMQESIAGITNDRRLQLLLIAFAFGAFFEGTSGFGTPVAITGAILIGIGFSPLAASAFSLIANTAPVAYGALGTPIIGLQAVTGLDLYELSGMVGRQLPFFSLIIPFWLIWAFAGFKRMLEVWPAILVTGVCFAIPQYIMSNFHGPTLVDVVAALISMASLVLFLKVWKPKTVMLETTRNSESVSYAESRKRFVGHGFTRKEVISAWIPWLILAAVVFVWGLPSTKTWLNQISNPQFPISGLNNMIQRMPPSRLSMQNQRPPFSPYPGSQLLERGSWSRLSSQPSS